MTACIAGEAAESVVPASHLLVPLVVGFVAAISGLVVGKVPSQVNRGSQAVLGVMIGASLSPTALHQTAAAAVPLTIVTALTVVVSLAAAALLAGVARLDRPTALLGMIAGGSAAAVACAEDVRADARLVAIMQYLRVALIAATAPVLAGWLLASPTPSGDSHPANPPAWHLVTGPNQGAGLVLVAVVAFAGTVAAGRLRLPSAALLGPMLLAATLTMTGTTAGFAPSGALRSALLTVIGLDVGLRFTRSALTRLGRLLPLALACSVAISIACAMLAWSLSKLVHIPLTDAYLATTPGGINAVIATAAASHADVPLISSVQSIRLFCMVLLAPLLIRLAARWQDRPDERGHD
ncbi:AbrB family transcriptional regulator [Actinoallomurus sp. NBC_01490]|uniref:AbrB family transcriptional regulator n=1 Tax=Actinoallomurus sp. NBC_01490 TaxID=2903557 RepID=UPI002E302F6E|nr:AbrB family transcriptional regulator [Actinoallomurus sp. NBC_01490]